MTNTVEIKWIDGTVRTVDETRLVQIRGGGVYNAKHLSDNYMNEYWDGVALLTEDEDPPVAKPKGIDPMSLTEWTLCEIEDSVSGIRYSEVKDGNERRGEKYSQTPLETKWNTILRVIHRPSPGMNMVAALTDGTIYEGCVGYVDMDISFGAFDDIEKHVLSLGLMANPVDGDYGKVTYPKS